jgi:hypothetical protein
MEVVKRQVTEPELRQILKSIVQRGEWPCETFELTQAQKGRVEDAFRMYGRRDKSKPLRVEVSIEVRPGRRKPKRKHVIAASTGVISECIRCGEDVSVRNTANGQGLFEPGTDDKHVCFDNRFVGSAFETNRRRH